ncbi:MAG: NAD(+)--dinitrogen-reductase ADP-D-ribosyltransferase [Pseudomonadota bacterium]
MDNDKHGTDHSRGGPTLPRSASQPLNRSNLPAVILGSLTFQRHPTPLTIDGVEALHRGLLKRLDCITDPGNRAQQFIDYMTVHFRLHAPDEAGLSSDSRLNRSKADYQRLLRGWAFDAESRDAAVIKGWVESRFGLVPRFHHVPILSVNDRSYQQYQHEYAEGIYNTNSLEAQLDLLYTYCQYELKCQFPEQTHFTLYRGSNDIEKIRLKEGRTKGLVPLLLNNLNSFSSDMERASEFGDEVFAIEVPLGKILFYSELLPNYLKAENEYIVLGGVYECRRVV